MSDPFQAPPAGQVPPPPPIQPVTSMPPAGQSPFAAPGSSGSPVGASGSPFGAPSTEVVVGAESSGARRSNGKIIGAVVGAVALIAAGTFAVVKVTSNNDRGGAASPTEVGNQLIGALEQQDLLGVIDLLLPGERDTFREPFTKFIAHLNRLEILDGSASGSSVGGVDFAFTDVVVKEEPTNVEDISNIVLDGTFTASVNGEKVPLGPLLLDDVFDGQRPAMDAAPADQPFEAVKLTVVEDGGRWYLSAFYTLAEQVRGDTDIPAEPLASVGAETPEGAVDDLLQSVSKLDLKGLLQMVDPTEAGALLRYAPLFLGDGQQLIDDVDITWAITDTKFSVEGSGDRRSVGIDSLTFTFSDPASRESHSVVYAGGCVTGDLLDDAELPCPLSDGASSTALNDLVGELGIGDPVKFQAVADTVRSATSDFDTQGIAVHQVDGRWYVSPLRSYFDIYDSVLTAIDADELRAIISAAREFSGTLDTGSLIDDVTETVGSGSSDGSSDGSIDLGDQTVDTIDLGEGDGEATGDTSSSDFSALDACYAESDASGAVSCFQAGIADGTIDPSFVPSQYRHSECGAAEQYWDGLSLLSDAEAVALVEQASPCFLALIASGELSAYEVPGELLDPSCLEGRNWYSVFDDADYDTRFSACTGEAMSKLSN